MLSLSKWDNQDETHSSGRELLSPLFPARPTFPIRQSKRLTVALKLPGFARFPLTRSSRSMPGKAAKTIITERQQEILQTLSRSVTAPSHFRQRASIIVLAFDGLRNQDIAARVGLTRRQVGLWR